MGKKSETSKGDSKKVAKTALKIRKSAKAEADATPKKAKAASAKVKAITVPQKATTAAPEGKNNVKPPTFEEIQLQAYFIAQKRAKLGLPGNSDTDWIQAEKELLEARVV